MSTEIICIRMASIKNMSSILSVNIQIWYRNRGIGDETERTREGIDASRGPTCNLSLSWSITVKRSGVNKFRIGYMRLLFLFTRVYRHGYETYRL